MELRRIRIPQVVVVLGATLIWMVTTGMLLVKPITDEVTECLQQRIASAQGKSLLSFEYNDQDTAQLLKRFYQARKGVPAWSGDEGPNSQAKVLLQILNRANREGLNPQDYGVDRIDGLMAAMNRDREENLRLDPEQLADLDLLLTEAFFSYAAHFAGGRADHQRQYPGWVYRSRQANLIETLQKALQNRDIERTLSDLAPRFYSYTKLREKLGDYIDISEDGGWRTIPTGRILRRGVRDNRIILLRTRLMMTSGALDSAKPKLANVFDQAVEAAVRQFQRQHGLKEDGVVNSATLRELNVPVEIRICQMAVNLDRLRWLPTDLGNRYILINIPDFKLEVVDNRQVVMNIRAIVGKTDKRTNLLSSRITSVELNPYWKVPKSIAVDEYLPKLKQNPRYLDGKNIKVFAGDYQTWPVSPKTVKWQKLSEDNFPYFLRQEPGPDNPLGRIKFLFSNDASVYIHDTPTRNLFAQNQRSFSHGCVRIEKPADLAAYLLQDFWKENWTSRKIQTEIRKGKNRMLPLLKPVPVHIVYNTVWIDGSGNLNFRPDIYDIDNIPANLLMIMASGKRPHGVVPLH